MAIQIQFRRDTAANWTSANPTLSLGELGLETDTGQFKVGNGSLAWNALSYAQMGPSGLQQGTVAPSYTNTLWLDTSATADAVQLSGALPLVSGGAFYRTAQPTATGQSATNGTIYYNPIFISNTITINQIAAFTTNVTVAATVRLGIYSDSNGAPGSLVYDSTDISVSTGTNTAITQPSAMSVTLTPGWYWLAFGQKSGTGTYFGVSPAPATTSGYFPLQRVSAVGSGAPYNGYTSSGFTTTLPATPTVTAVAAVAPIAFIRTA